MIVVDSAARIAVLFEEPEKQAFQDIIDGDERCVLSAVNAHETACILRARHGLLAIAEVSQWLTDNKVEIVPFNEVQVHGAAVAFDHYGKAIGPKGAPQSSRLRGLCPFQDDELPLAVQGRRLQGNRRVGMSLN